MDDACVQWLVPLDTLRYGQVIATCLILDMCPYPNVSSGIGRRTQAIPMGDIIFLKILQTTYQD